ncbi:MAG: hypothetical protein JSW03_09160 [Candidatus Eiseniibacteriota bacterium]|nr:MAG: hypothetical protein JSW03_09160 [Candidatus Eisenbacteria bacterium]
MRKLLAVLSLSIVAALSLSTVALAVDKYRDYFLASDVEPHVYVAREVFFLRPWGGTTPSTSYVVVCTEAGMKYEGRLVRISDYEIALSSAYAIKKTGQRVEKQVIIPKKNVVIAWIYW